MNFKTTIMLIVCLAIVGLFVFVTRNESPTEPPPAPAAKMFDIPSADIAKLTVTPADDKRIVLEKRDGKWQMTEPVAAGADANNVDELARALADLESHGKSDASGANADVTGLASPKYRVEITDKLGKTVKLAVGKPTGVGDELFVQKDGDKQADRVAASLYASLNKPASAFRELKLIDVKSPEIKTMAITSGSGSVTLDRAGNNWQITGGPTTMPADDAAVSDLLFGLSGMRASEYIAEKSEDLKRYGLDDPQVTVAWTAQPTALPVATTKPASQPATQPIQTGVVKFGRYQDLRKENVFVQTSGSGAIGIVPARTMTTFDKKPLDLRDKNVLKIDKSAVQSISIATSKPPTTQPTTKPAVQTIVTLERNKEAANADWHAPFVLPGSTTAPSTVPTTAPTTAVADATTQPATAPATQPTTQAATKPAAPPPKWLVLTTDLVDESKSAKSTGADETGVDALLTQLSPLRVEKFLAESSPATQPVDEYTVTIRTASGSVELSVSDPGQGKNPIGHYQGLSFELNRFFLDKITGKFEPSAKPDLPPMGMPGGMPGGMMQP